MTIFDDCTVIDNWQATQTEDFATNTIEIASGLLQFSYASVEGVVYPYNLGGMFYKRTVNGLWDLSSEPLMKITIRTNDPTALSQLYLDIVTGSWETSRYLIGDKISSVDQVIEIDLRYPDEGVQPDLTTTAQVSFTVWDVVFNVPGPQINLSLIEIDLPPPMPLEAWMSPSDATIFVGNTINFKAENRGGTPPLSYIWSINGTPTQDTGDTISVQSIMTGQFIIACDVSDQITTIPISGTLNVLEEPPPPPPPPAGFDYLKSEIRGILIHLPWWVEHDWNLIAQTCAEKGINSVYIETYSDFFASGHFAELDTAISAFQNVGLKAHVLNTVLLGYIDDETRARNQFGEQINWMCPVRPATRNYLLSMINDIIRNYNLDGFQFDYIRWENEGSCYCDVCKNTFILETGFADTVWPDDVLSGGKYHWEWIDWRKEKITQLVRDMVSIIKTIKPKTEISTAVYTAFSDTYSWPSMDVGQDAGEWVSEGLLNMINPMAWTTDISGGNESLQDRVSSSLKFMTGGDQEPGLIPMAIYTYPIETDPITFRECINIARNYDVGFIMWRYGGPGLETYVDIRPYLEVLNLPIIFNITNIRVFQESEDAISAKITWDTSLPTTSKVEYSFNHLFSKELITGEYGRGHHYTKINYASGNIIEDLTYKTRHSIKIPTPEEGSFFRIWSLAENGQSVITTVYNTKDIAETTPPEPSIPSWLIAIPLLGLILSTWEKKG